MNIPLSDMAVSVLFMLCLVMLLRFKNKLRSENKDCFRNIFAGLSFLAIASLINIYSKVELLTSVPFISEPLFFKLVYWILNITGLALLVSGISLWLPLAKTLRMRNQKTVQSLSIIKRIEQLTCVESRTDVIIRQALKHMMDCFDFQLGAVYVYSRLKNKMIFISSSQKDSQTAFEPGKMMFSDEKIKKWNLNHGDEAYRYFENEMEKSSMPDFVFPLAVNEKLIGLYLFYKNPEMEYANDELINLKIAAEVIGQKITMDLMLKKNRQQEEENHWLEKLMSGIDYQLNIEKNMKYAYDRLKEKIEFDYSHLYIVQNKKNLQKITYSNVTRGFLNEFKSEEDETGTVYDKVKTKREILYIDNLAEETDLNIDLTMLKCDMRSLAALPLIYGQEIIGVLTFVSENKNNYSQKDIRLIQKTTQVFASLAKIEKNRFDGKTQSKRRQMLDSFTERLVRFENIHSLFAKTAEIISDVIKPGLTRVSTYDNRGVFLNSRAMVNNTDLGTTTPATGSMVLSLMPYHSLVHEKGRTMLINQEETDRKISIAEQNQFFGEDVKSALLVPIKVQDRTVGVISIGDNRCWDNFHLDKEDIRFVQSLANLLSIAIKLHRYKSTRVDSKSIERLQEGIGTGSRISPDSKSRIKSSLTGIFGSIELLKNNENPSRENIDRYLSIIDKSAKKIGDFVEI